MARLTFDGERVVRWQGLPVWWPRRPRVLAKAIWRIDELQNAIQWMLRDLDGGAQDRAELRRQIFHLETILTARWDANDGQLTDFICNCGGSYCETKKKAADQHISEPQKSPIISSPKPWEETEWEIENGFSDPDLGEQGVTS